MKPYRLNIVLLMMLVSTSLFSQRKMTDGTIVYDIVIEKSDKDAPGTVDLFNGAVTTVYLSGNKSRTDMVSSLGSESTIYNAETGKAVILKEYSGQKLMITLTSENWTEKNSNYSGINFETTAETKTIGGYLCKKAVAKLKDGKSYTVYYATTLSAGKVDYNPLFSSLPGVVLEYEINMGKTKFKYTLATINFDAVRSDKFEAPKSGYRVMTYEENKQIKKS